MKKTPLTLEEHKELATFLNETRREYLRWYIRVADSMPQNKKPVKMLAKIYQAIVCVRCHLEEDMFHNYRWCPEFPSNRIERIKIYYPGDRTEQEAG